ncbi:MAG: hypothetical protein Q8R70_12170 [Methanoregula sp.]|nr:hypothetical protein [Methanoregula sp.]
MRRSGPVIAVLVVLALVSVIYFVVPGFSIPRNGAEPSGTGPGSSSGSAPGLDFPTMVTDRVLPAPAGSNATDRVTRTYPYVLRGETGTLRLDLDPGLYHRLAAGSPPLVCTMPVSGLDPCPDAEVARYYRGVIDRPEERLYLDALVQAIRGRTVVRDDQARIAISLVQQIPYGYNESYANGSGNLRTPSMILYDRSGICDEKSLLLAYLLRELGYGVVLFSFPGQEHTAIGIRSPAAYAYNATGYAFVETTFPAIVTDDQGEYGNGGRLAGPPVLYPIADGIAFDSIAFEYADAREFIRLRESVRTSGTRLNGASRTEVQDLCRKYGLYSCTT